MNPGNLPIISTDDKTQDEYEMLRVFGELSHNVATLGALRHNRGATHSPIIFAAQGRDSTALWRSKIDELTELEVSEVCVLGGRQFKRYRDMRLDDQSHKFAIMLATRSFPGVKSDSIFNEGKFSGTKAHGCHGKELYIRQQAEAAGISTNGKWYCSSIANRNGATDPGAWVDSVADVKKVCRERNLTILDGYVSHEGHAVEPDADLPIDPSLVRREAREIMSSHPGSKYEEVYEGVYNRRTGRGAGDNYVPRVQETDVAM